MSSVHHILRLILYFFSLLLAVNCSIAISRVHFHTLPFAPWTMAHQSSSRPLRPLAPRTASGGLAPANPDPSPNEEHKVKRASMACAECKRRRTKVLAFIISLVSHPSPPSATRLIVESILTLESYSHMHFSAAMIPQAAPAPNARYRDVSVSSTSPRTNAAKWPPSGLRRKISGFLNE